MPKSRVENENSSKNSSNWIIGIVLAVVLLAGGSYLVYRFWPRKSAEQVQQEQEKKDKLRQQIKLIEEKIVHCKKVLEEKKAGRRYEYKALDEEPKPTIETWKKTESTNSDKEFQKLLNQRIEVWNEYIRLDNAIADLINQQQNQTKDKNKAIWDRQKDGNWKALTGNLDKDPAVKEKFNDFITAFYNRYKELKKNISTHPAVNLKGFGNFYIEESRNGIVTEMGSTEIIKDESSVQTLPDKKLINMPLIIKLNQLYLLNNGRNPGGKMDVFYYEEPGPEKKYLPIDFDKLIQTIAHEIAHAFQDAKNVSDDKVTESGDFAEKLSDCYESGEGERDKDYNLIKPKYPELVKEHKQFEEEIEQMIKNDTQIFPSFKAWWEATS